MLCSYFIIAKWPLFYIPLFFREFSQVITHYTEKGSKKNENKIRGKWKKEYSNCSLLKIHNIPLMQYNALASLLSLRIKILTADHTKVYIFIPWGLTFPPQVRPFPSLMRKFLKIKLFSSLIKIDLGCILLSIYQSRKDTSVPREFDNSWKLISRNRARPSNSWKRCHNSPKLLLINYWRRRQLPEVVLRNKKQH